MRVRITSPGDYDRHEKLVRFTATIDGKPVGFIILNYALFIMGHALELGETEPIQVYHVGGSLLSSVVKFVFTREGADPDRLFLIDHNDVLSVTGRSGEGHDHAPKKWIG